MVKKQKTGLVSLAYSDSENDDDSFIDEEDQEDEELNDESNDDNKQNNDKPKDEEIPEVYFEDIYGDKDLTILEFHKSLYGKSVDEIQIPPITKMECPEELQLQIENFYEKVNMGYNFNQIIQKRKSLRNPSIYEKMISYCQIDEMATNYPQDIYNPEPFLGDESFYEELSRLQKEEMEKREREKKENLTATKRAAGVSTLTSEKKSKWDTVSTQGTSHTASSNSAAIAAAMARVQNIVQQATSTKPTVISAFGTISRKK